MSTDREPAAAGPSREVILNRALSIYDKNLAVQLATTGGSYSPWVLGAYFASDGADLLLVIESSGKTYQNLQKNRSVAFSISENDASKDFLQGCGEAVFLSPEDEAMVRRKLVEKLPSFQTYTPVVPVRIRVRELFVSSLQSGWFPAKIWRAE